MGSTKNANALQKERQALLKKKFFKTMGDLCVQLLGENVLHLLPADQKEKLYILRIREIKVEFSSNNIIDATTFEQSANLIGNLFYKYTCPYGPTQYELTRNQSDVYLFYFNMFISQINKTSFPNAEQFIEKTKLITQIVHPQKQHINHLVTTVVVASNYFHDLSQYYVRGNFKFETLPGFYESHPIRYCYSFEWFKAPSHKFNIDGRSRPATQLLNVFKQPELPPICITPAQLGMKTPFANIPLEVYIQQHAINRLHERLDVLPTYLINMSLFISLQEPETCFDSHGNHLLVVKYMNVKLGYLRVDLVEGRLLVRTFLLFTQDSTPEGEKIKQFSGFQKEDITYLHLDKISAFINLDFSENSRLVKLIKQCGLGEFVECQKSLKIFVQINCNQDVSHTVEKYLSATTNTAELESQLA